MGVVAGKVIKLTIYLFKQAMLPLPNIHSSNYFKNLGKRTFYRIVFVLWGNLLLFLFFLILVIIDWWLYQ